VKLLTLMIFGCMSCSPFKSFCIVALLTFINSSTHQQKIMDEKNIITLVISIFCGIGFYVIIGLFVRAGGYEEGAHPVWIIFASAIAYNFIKKKRE